jgi:uncharacterized membrane protein YkvI
LLDAGLSVARQWGGTLNRAGYGFLVIVAFYKLGLVPPFPKVFGTSVPLNEPVHSIAVLIGMVVGSLLVGAVAVTLGSLNLWDRRFDDAVNLDRAMRVSDTNNALLVEAYRDAMVVYDLRNGADGALMIIVFAAIMSVLYGVISGNITPKAEYPTLNMSMIMPIFAGFISTRLLNFVATRSLLAIDDVLNANNARPK